MTKLNKEYGIIYNIFTKLFKPFIFTILNDYYN